MSRPAGLAELRRAVLGHPICCGCGGCAGLCPYVLCLEDRIAAIEECGCEDGRCYAFCPRTGDESPGLFGDVGRGGPLGPYEEAAAGRGLFDVADGRAQYGGLVTALVVAALREGLADAAVVTTEVAGLPHSTTVRTEAEVGTAAGSKFAVAPTLREVNQALQRGEGRLLVVALPCQATAVARMRLSGSDGRKELVPLVVGLFCTWALTQRGWLALLDEAGGGLESRPRVRKVDIPPPPARVMTLELAGGEATEVPLDRVKEAVRPGCAFCTDLTAENADLSVGRLEEGGDRNVLLVRSVAGARLVQTARAAGLVEIEPLGKPGLARLVEASCAKKDRAVGAARSADLDLPYLAALGRRGAIDPGGGR